MQASRQKLPKDWRKKLAYIQARVAEAAQALPQEQRPSTSSDDEGSPALGYLQAREMRDALAAGTSERSLFGGLTGPASAWDKLVRAYEKDSARPPSPSHRRDALRQRCANSMCMPEGRCTPASCGPQDVQQCHWRGALCQPMCMSPQAHAERLLAPWC